MGTDVTVCHEGCVEERVNDRGLHLADREIDLSAAAANKIGVQDKGVASVEVYCAWSNTTGRDFVKGSGLAKRNQ